MLVRKSQYNNLAPLMIDTTQTTATNATAVEKLPGTGSTRILKSSVKKNVAAKSKQDIYADNKTNSRATRSNRETTNRDATNIATSLTVAVGITSLTKKQRKLNKSKYKLNRTLTQEVVRIYPRMSSDPSRLSQQVIKR